MKTAFNYTATIVTVLSIASCDPIEIDADLPDRGGLITVTSLFGADSVWRVNVNASKSILDSKEGYGVDYNDLPPIPNAQVTIRENGLPHTSLVYAMEIFFIEYWSYISPSREIRPAAGKTYDIEVTVPDVGKATATCFVPEPVKLLSVKAQTEILEVNSDRVNGPYKDHTLYFAVPAEIVIDDPAGDNYYEIIVKYSPQNPGFFRWAAPAFTKDTRYHNTGLSRDGNIIPGPDDQYYSVLFSDKDPEAKHLKISMMMPAVWERTLDDGHHMEARTDINHIVVLRTLSKEYFQYAASQELQSYSYDNPFAQPVVVYANIEGGLGIFAGFSEYAMKADFE